MYQTEKLLSIVKQVEETEEGRKIRKEKNINHRLRNVQYNLDILHQKTVHFSIGCLVMITASSFFLTEPLSIMEKVLGFLLSASVLTMFFILHQLARKRLMVHIKNLLVELCEKPFEVRVETSKPNKLKVIIEENLLIGGAHVIKEKSKHMTAYIDLSERYESIVGMIVALAKEAEVKFK